MTNVSLTGMMLHAALSSVLLRLGLMALEASPVGIAQNEGNRVWGVLPWLFSGLSPLRRWW